jgi:glycosyltransferase involved in cell wall biosynthesis
MVKKKYLIFEPAYKGHQVDYIRVIASFIESNPVTHDFIFLISSELSDYLKSSIELLNGSEIKSMKFVKLKDMESKRCSSKNLFMSSFFKWLITTKYAARLNANHIHYLFLDHMQLALSLRLPLPKGVTVSGILFRPSIHYKEFSQNDICAREKIRDTRKKAFYKFMLKNPALSVVFTLDEYFVKYYKEKLQNSHKLHFLPDPYVLLENNDNYRHISRSSSRNEKKMFLLFGVLQERKGIYQTLEAISTLHPDVLGKARFIFAGELDSHIKDHFIQQIAKIRLSHRNITLDLQNYYLSNEEIRKLVNGCDVVLIPYQRHVGSSGILLTAAAFKKPIITQSVGLLGFETRKYKLGLTVDTTNPREIAKAIERFVYSDVTPHEIDPLGMANFVHNRTPELFASTLISTITTL